MLVYLTYYGVMHTILVVIGVLKIYHDPISSIFVDISMNIWTMPGLTVKFLTVFYRYAWR